MILTQTRAIFLDAYRELNARKLFWVAIVISLIIVLAGAAVGLRGNTLTILWFNLFDLPSMPDGLGVNDASGNLDPSTLYKFMFSTIAIPLWLTWGAVILALVSTAGTMPEFVAGGAIEMSLAKPISRVRLLLTKYASALIFVAFQGLVFCGGWFLILGIRGGEWQPRVFLGIPIVLAVFSSIYCVTALIGFLTRSTITALIGGLIFWFVVFLMNSAELVLHQFKVRNELGQERIAARLEANTAQRIRSAELAKEAGREVDPAIYSSNQTARERLEDRQKRLLENAPTLARWHGILYGVKTFLPKTQEMTGLLNRSLLSKDELARFTPDGPPGRGDRDETGVSERDVAQRQESELRSRTLAWVLGTSLAFQVAVVGLMAWLFSRKDF